MEQIGCAAAGAGGRVHLTLVVDVLVEKDGGDNKVAMRIKRYH